MKNQFERTYMLIGDENLNKLKNSKIAIFGIGGVGGFVAESLARCGVGELHLIDNDTINVSNLNRQIIALHSTIGKYKVDVMEDRIKDINPNCRVFKYKEFILEETISNIPIKNLDYVIDAIDTMTGKLAIIKQCNNFNVKVISCMGTGNKVDPTCFLIKDIFETKVCPVCKVMRKLLKQNNIKSLKVLYSIENPITPLLTLENNENHRQIPASISFVPSVAGLLISSEVVKDITNFLGNGKNLS
ncbi:MAG: tRNA threonylcarbamoyladenosine dehydratase [Clostridia bacterium]|nr:tRNA threonylcarbamoyladenosine dehydratase [Clostridia bacterium]